MKTLLITGLDPDGCAEEVAHHEAGHAVLAARFEFGFHYVEIAPSAIAYHDRSPSAMPGGVPDRFARRATPRTLNRLGQVALVKKWQPPETLLTLEQNVFIRLGGPIAAARFLGLEDWRTAPGSWEDFLAADIGTARLDVYIERHSGRRAPKPIAILCLDDEAALAPWKPEGPTPESIQRRKEFDERAVRLVDENWSSIEEVANELLLRRRLSYSQVRAIMGTTLASPSARSRATRIIST